MLSTKATRLSARQMRLPGLYLDGLRLRAQPGPYAGGFALSGVQVLTQVLLGNYGLSGRFSGAGQLIFQGMGTITLQGTLNYVWGADTDGTRLGNGGDGVMGDALTAQNGALGGGGGGAGDSPGGNNNALGGYGGHGFGVVGFVDGAGSLLDWYGLVLASNAAYPVPAGAQSVALFAVGAGGPGGSGLGTTGTNAAGGGGGGALAYVYAALRGATSLQIVIGQGGAPQRGVAASMARPRW